MKGYDLASDQSSCAEVRVTRLCHTMPVLKPESEQGRCGVPRSWSLRQGRAGAGRTSVARQNMG